MGLSSVRQLEIQFLARLTEYLKAACSTCSDVQGLCKQCELKYRERFQLAKRGIPLAKIEWLLEGKHEDLKVKLYLIDKKTYSKPIDLYKAVLVPLLEHETEIFQKGLSLCFVGTNSAGKTCAASWVMSKLRGSYYITFADLHRIFAASYTDEDSADLFQEVINKRFLVIDELGSETVKSGAVRQLADTYIKQREESLKPTILISNLPIDVIASSPARGGYGPSFFAMLGQRYRLYHFGTTKGDLRVRSSEVWPI